MTPKPDLQNLTDGFSISLAEMMQIIIFYVFFGLKLPANAVYTFFFNVQPLPIERHRRHPRMMSLRPRHHPLLFQRINRHQIILAPRRYQPSIPRPRDTQQPPKIRPRHPQQLHTIILKHPQHPILRHNRQLGTGHIECDFIYRRRPRTNQPSEQGVPC